MVLITLLAGSILILAIVLGIQSGQHQLELKRQQEIGIALQQAIESRAEGNTTVALEHYRSVLALDPNNQLAADGVNALLATIEQGGGAAIVQIATPTESQTAITTPVVASSTVITTPAAALNTASFDAFWQEAESALKAGRPQLTINNLLQIRQGDPNFRSEEMQTMLFTAYVQLAGQQDSEDKLEESLLSLENALAIRPTAATVRQERDMLSDYLDMDSFYEANWAEAIRLLKSLQERDANYRDVSRRLLEATIAYGDQLLAGQPCDAIEQYQNAVALVGTTPVLSEKQGDAQLACTTFETAVALSGTVTATLSALGTPVVLTETSQTAANNAANNTANNALSATGLRGKVLYSSRDPNDGRFRIYSQSAANSAMPPTLLVEDASQPELRSDGQRLAFHNLRSDLGGISSFDPGSGLMIRFTAFAEDALPSWNANGGRIAFASTREGDRRWRLYMVWAQQDGETTQVDFGESPAWHPSADILAYRGCDPTGNNCGLWQMDGSGANHIPLTTIANDNRPAWSPNGQIVFMSDGRTGNFDIFHLDPVTRQVVQLTDSPAADLLPTVSPDGQWVAFVSNREGAWKLYVVSIDGGAARLLAPIRGDFGDWQLQKLDWVN